ncbi:metal-dependent hydrolase [Cocleimonas sp. KMM 6892]|uniref:metal-dependent hydrolase n=1 Tax=unclassified Cocleimonas TaxID=2639732 RepID=UPI002DBC8C0A|nr:MULTISPECIES: metal-dependent hydrolase [unclassified Cocleimonas]MEB8433372.1 metal-dependent hydrolase [Cocleimonas sp. KMM 6892]MEC4716183.1 metal-dependent hydrolase [Cocleimonas sp. KMM 6895]MEC4745924.1 metal-dependent hydrolase [Cocleimonas sp. KMM 6896]
MPFTPIHMGPGILIKSLLQGSFSLMVFGWAQIVMDIQPLIVLITGEGHLHGFSHTYVGASLLAVFAALSGKYLSEFGLMILGISKKSNPIKIAWWVVFLSAFIGTFSHVLLDSIMHSDVEPFYPITLQNNFLGFLTIDQLHKLCLYSGIVGAGIFYFVQLVNKKT